MQITNATALASWLALNAFLKSATEPQCWELLKEERTGKKRLNYLIRIYGKANRLRSERERRELLGDR